MEVLYAVTMTMLVLHVHAFHKPEMSCSSFDFQLKTLRTVVELEVQMAGFQKQMSQWQTTMEAMFEKYGNTDEKRENRTKELINSLSELQRETTQKTNELETRLLDSQKTIEQEIQNQASLALSGLNATMESFFKQQEDITKRRSQQVAFTVHRPTRKLVDGGYSPTFSTIVMNMGGGYNSTNGKFHCPVSGLYSFFVTLFASGSRTGSNELHCYVRKSASRVALVDTFQGQYDSASVSVFIHLSVGDVVDLECHNWSYIFAGMATSFSGALIHMD